MMGIKIKNREWVDFKGVVLKMLHALSEEYEKIFFPESHENFELYVNGCEIQPVFTKKPEYLKIEYDFSLCEIELRLLSIYLYANVLRIDFSLKNKNEQGK
jgi:hypothetical protein